MTVEVIDAIFANIFLLILGVSFVIVLFKK